MSEKHSKFPDPKWDELLSTERLRPSKVKDRSKYDARTAFENDYDRVIFSSAFRRLKNKAQVFSLEGHDFVRTRLTHSIEVSTIGRAMGDGVAKHLALDARDVGSIVATACLLHDIGNPPYGHSGERAIGSWFQEAVPKHLEIVNPEEIGDLTAFEGNAQALRIATRTQWSGLEYGLNLTSATLSALVKYPCSSVESNKNGPKALSKFGYFKDDKASFDELRRLTGLIGHMRHPLTFLMEAADDIAYATGDLEDVLKKGLVDYETIRGILEHEGDERSKDLVKTYLDRTFNELAIVSDKRERQQIALQRFCQMAVRLMTKSAIECFIQNSSAIVGGEFDAEIVQKMKLSGLCKALKAVMYEAVYSHLEIAHREQASAKVIHGLLDAIMSEFKRAPEGTLANKVYVPAPRNSRDASDTSKDYQIALRMTDYVSGMTDAFALAEYQRINAMRATL
jgi:dGTPase